MKIKVITLALLFLMGCAQLKHRGDETLSRTESGMVDPNGKSEAINNPEDVLKPASMSIWLDGGGVRGLYAAGAIKAIQTKKIPIQEIYANETGAIVAAVIAFSKSPNLIEWNLKRLRLDDVFGLEKNSITGLLHSKSIEQKLRSSLYKLFGKINSQELPIKIFFWIDGQWVHDGNLAELVLRSTLDRGGFRSPEIWNEYRDTKGAPLMFHIKTGGGEIEIENQTHQQLIANLDSIDPSDYQKLNQVVFFGKKAAEAKTSELASLLRTGK